MTDFSYTKSQEKAIFTEGKNIIISAAAGSGKTKVLVDRVINLVIKEKKDIDKMIIVTFTNKASVEMKDRIRSSFEEEISKDGSDVIFLRRQIKRLKNAQIKTLHSFCSDMLREYFYLSEDLSPSFKVMNDNQGAMLRRDSMDEVFDKSYEEMNDDFKVFLNNFSQTRTDRSAREVIEKTYHFINSQIRPLDWLKEKTEDTISLKFFIGFIKEKLKKLEDSTIDLLKYIDSKKMRDKYREVIESDYNSFKYLDEILDVENENSLGKFISLSNLKFERFPGKAKIDSEIEKNHAKSVRDSYKNSYKNIISLTLNTDQKTLDIFNPIEKTVLREIYRLTKEFIQTYQKKKQEKNYLDFIDMEQKFIKLLDNKEAVEKIKENFLYIFFDEYQDSNEIQNYIIEKLKGENNLFFVGDVKQSIYGFRLAEPNLFLQKLKDYEKDQNSERIDLNENFRTDKDVIDFNNYIFDNLMTEKSSNIDYKNGGHRLNPQKIFKEIKNPKVKLSLLKKNINSEDYLVELIEEIINEGFEYKDIAILFRTSSKVYKYEESMKSANIPFFSDISKVSFDKVEVEFFINILKYIVNPKDDISLLSVIRSSLFDFTEDDIAEIKLSSEETSFYKAFENFDKEGEILEKKINFQTLFYDFYYKLQNLNLYEFGNYIFEKSRLYDFLIARDRSEERIKNIEAFIDMMADYDENNYNGLYGFLSYISSLRAGKSDNIQASRDLSENENLVRLMTIHKSKGLQFPIVIVVEADKSFNKEDTRSQIVFDKNIGIGINIADYENKLRLSSIKRNIIIEKSSIKDKKEEMRILYVGLTRAINKMYIVGKFDLSEKNIKKIMTEDYLELNSYMDWIISILLKDKIMQDYSNYENLTNNFSKNNLKIEIIDALKSPDHLENIDFYNYLKSGYKNNKEVKKLIEILDKPYSYENDTKKSLKKSVTEISKNFEKEEEGYAKSEYNPTLSFLEYKKPDFLTEKKYFKAVDKGTIIHKIFQYLEIKSYTEETLKKDIASLIIERKISKEEVSLLEIDKILGFFNNTLIQNLNKQAKKIRKEESFLMKHKDIYVNGQIDLLFEMEKYIVLIDFKTDQIKKEGFYDKQLKIYEKALEEATRKPVKDSYIYWYNFKEFRKN